MYFKTLVKLLGSRQPLLYSYQASLPKLPVPDLDQTMKSVSPWKLIDPLLT